MNNYTEILEYFKNTSTPEKIVSLIGDQKLINALLAWKSVIIRIEPDIQICELKGDNERWEWLWSNIKWDKEKYQIVTGLKVQEVDLYFQRLCGLKLIFPDGTIDKYATLYLNSIITNLLKQKNPKKV